MCRFVLIGLLLTGSSLFSQQAATYGIPAVSNFKLITGKERAKWFVRSTVGLESILGAGTISAAWGTMRNNPVEYGPHWEGFGKRYGMRLTGVSTGNAIEAAAGAMWKEDPRYFPSPDRRFNARVWHVIKTTFLAPGPGGRYRIAYARHMGNAGNNFLSNTWRVHSEASAGDAALRCVWGITGKMTGNAFEEFWPDVKRLVFRR